MTSAIGRDQATTTEHETDMAQANSTVSRGEKTERKKSACITKLDTVRRWLELTGLPFQVACPETRSLRSQILRDRARRKVVFPAPDSETIAGQRNHIQKKEIGSRNLHSS